MVSNGMGRMQIGQPTDLFRPWTTWSNLRSLLNKLAHNPSQFFYSPLSNSTLNLQNYTSFWKV
jgi:hypothetical protein